MAFRASESNTGWVEVKNRSPMKGMDSPLRIPMYTWQLLLLRRTAAASRRKSGSKCSSRSEEHTSELQSPCNLVCRLLLEKKKNTLTITHTDTTVFNSTSTL